MAGGKIVREDGVRQGLKDGLVAVRRMVTQRHAQKRREANRGEEVKTSGSGGAADKHQMPAKTPSFLDIVYNYFTENTDKEDEREKCRREQQEELKTLTEIRTKILNEGALETDYQENIEERFDDKISAQWAK
jgi:hypothetical protein